jgi:plasmid maintenance system antidote protein VapI
MATRVRIRMKLKDPLAFREMVSARGWLTNVDAAKGLGVSHYTINELYHQRPVGPKTILKVAKALGIEPQLIAEYTD